MEQKQKNFTYILGAGASIGTIPIVNDIPGGLHEFCKDMDSLINHSTYNNQDLLPLRKLCEEIKETVKNVKSFDTYAKKLWLSNEIEKYDEYRKAFSAFIMYRSLTNVINTRFDLFFASLIEKTGNKYVIPKNVNIISWNYDQLVEMSLCHLLRMNSKDLASTINIYSNYTDLHQSEEPGRFSLIKLNGTAGNKFVYDEIAIKPVDPRVDPLSRISIAMNKVLEYYTFLKAGNNHGLEIDFSWSDDNKYIKVAREKAKKILENTDYLVIIGYSFPTFNRIIDRYLLSSLNNIEKIFLQVPKDDMPSVKQKFCSITNLNLESNQVFDIPSIDEFYIPFEYHGIFNEPIYVV